ncbi:MAG: FAD:protein FMN transferase [Methylococcales symbiont of Hymedesmia sp. n. MRB-2018]|nr:MAG: FAD:protein FMN transferase [Methylococcales symbiont of Hymedesmia sp. n. MRB-2018]KAF3984180.1 MAG: FAD:protein FMN transferase [Methylococcales symbiont of Hymedesmia sp. n. MRB-2018]
MNEISRCKLLLGTFVEVTLKADLSDDELIQQSELAFMEIARIEQLMSYHNPDSELSVINVSAHICAHKVSKDMHKVLALALRISRLTAGLYDISIAPKLVQLSLLPDHGFSVDLSANWQDIALDDSFLSFKKPLQLDLGGIAKGYAIDQAMSTLDSNIQAIINAGGDMRMTHWKGQQLGIRKPYSKKGEIVAVAMKNRAVASSSGDNTEAEHTIISPRTKQTVADKRSVSVFANSCIVADALTKVVFLMSDYQSVLDQFQAQALFIDP